MICILQRGQDKEITGWIIATDLHDARRQAEGAGQRALASLLYTRDVAPPPGTHELPVYPTGIPCFTMLVS